MKKTILAGTIISILTACSNVLYQEEYQEIDTPDYSCRIQLPTDREIDIWNNYPDNEHITSVKRCNEERNSCPDDYYKVLENFAYFQQTHNRTQRSSIMKEFRSLQNKFCLKGNYESKTKKVKKKGFFS
jgi:hypothetical protein